MRFLVAACVLSLCACGTPELRVGDPYADGGSTEDDGGIDAGTGGGTGTGGGSATGGGAATGGGSATGGGAPTGGGTATGGGSATGGGDPTGGGAGTGGGDAMGGGAGGGTPSCTGCLVGTQCVTTTSDSQCGADGAQCVACTSPDTCSPAGACDLDPASNWLVRPTQVRVADVWDAASPPDIFMEIWCPSSATTISYTTPVISDSTTANWTTGGCTLTAQQLLTGGFDFRVWDKDIASDDLVQGRTPATPQAADLRAGSLTGSTANLLSITFTFIKQ